VPFRAFYCLLYKAKCSQLFFAAAVRRFVAAEPMALASKVQALALRVEDLALRF